ncbi:MAG: ankyrin repeat domain-containing protein, partial [Clostridiales bacterium]|nr:ankyrin repeat domain-containing protein [Clostridiales bacterium]
MELYEIKRLYDRIGREAALEAYPAAIEASAGNEDDLNALAFLAADYSDTGALKLLFDAGVSPVVTDEYGFTLLHFVAKQNESGRNNSVPAGAVSETVRFLLENKVSALRKDENEGMTCYHYAARKGLAELVEVLAQRGTKLNMTDREGNTGIHIACEYIKFAEESKKEDYFRVVKAFADGGLDIDEKNDSGKTALDIAVDNNAKKIAAFLSGTLTDDDGAVVSGGMTLHQAAEKGDADAIKAIVNNGVDLNAFKDGETHDFGGCTALSVAVAYLQNNAVETLLAYGADPSFKDGNGHIALYYLFSSLFNASLNSKLFEERRIPKLIKAMISAGYDINQAVDDDGDSLLLLACKSGCGTIYNNYSVKSEVVGEIMKHSPDINTPNRFGETVLMQVCARDFDIMENIQLELLERGADVTAADQNGDTALHYAAHNNVKNGAKTLCEMLLDFGA